MNNEIKEILECMNKVSFHQQGMALETKQCKVLLDYITNLQEENERLNLIIKAIKKQCDVTESYEINEFIRQLEEEPLDSIWLKRVAGESK